MRSVSSIATGTAWLLAAVGVTSFIAGWRLGWTELFVVAASCLLALLIAIPFVLRSGQVHIERTINPNRVEVAQRAVAELQATNQGSGPSPALTVEERIDGRVVPVDVPALASGETTQFIYTLPTDRRGKFQIGPASIGRSDPLGLLYRSMGETSVEDFYVHPRTVPVAELSAGFAKDLEGPTFDSSPAGDVAFHTIREYQPGDDARHVHWMSTARKNTLMVRHYVDNRRPQIAALVDGDSASSDPDGFERSIEIAASIGISAIHRDTQAAVWIDDVAVLGRGKQRDPEALLDTLAAIGPGPTDLGSTVDRLLRTETGTSVLVVATAGRDPSELVAFADRFRRRCRVILLDVGSDSRPMLVPGVQVLRCPSLEAFSAGWSAL